MSLAGYLDHAATAMPKAPGVAAAVARCLETSCGNPGRGGHRLTVAASRHLESAREQVAALLGGDPDRTLLGPGATFWLNTVLSSFLSPGDRVVVSPLEHNAVMRPLRELERRLALRVTVLEPADPGGVPTPSELAAAVAAAPTRLVVLTHASNVTGRVLPIAQLCRAASPVPVLVDGAQAAGSVPIDLGSLGAAAFVCSAHKGLLAPPGIGVLSLARGVEVEPLVRGGTGSKSESEDMPDTLPDRLEAGTPNVAAAAGLAAACAWLEAEGLTAVQNRTEAVTRRLVERLGALSNVRVIDANPDGRRIGIVSFVVARRDVGDVAAWLDRERGLQLRAGLHCAPAAHRWLGTFPSGTLRAGIGPFTPEETIDRLIAAVNALA